MKSLRITAIIISALMLLPVLSGCNTKPDETTAAQVKDTDTVSETSGDTETEPDSIISTRMLSAHICGYAIRISIISISSVR